MFHPPLASLFRSRFRFQLLHIPITIVSCDCRPLPAVATNIMLINVLYVQRILSDAMHEQEAAMYWDTGKLPDETRALNVQRRPY